MNRKEFIGLFTLGGLGLASGVAYGQPPPWAHNKPKTTTTSTTTTTTGTTTEPAPQPLVAYQYHGLAPDVGPTEF